MRKWIGMGFCVAAAVGAALVAGPLERASATGSAAAEHGELYREVLR